MTSGSDININQDMNRFEEECVIPLLHYHKEEKGKECLCIVMPKGECNLDEIICNGQIAGRDLDAILHFPANSAKAIKHMHDKNIVHLDIKPKNIVRIHSHYKAIDFDASTGIGKPLTDKCSSGFIPPELAKVKLLPKETVEKLRESKRMLKAELVALASECDYEGIAAKVWRKKSERKNSTAQMFCYPKRSSED